MCTLSVLKALLTPMIGVVTVYIAYRQWQDNQLRLKTDSYDRKFCETTISTGVLVLCVDLQTCMGTLAPGILLCRPFT
jgi:hypothetical protein